jgi:hypothetical protein
MNEFIPTPIPARDIDRHTRDYWIAEGLITISGIWPFKKAHLTKKALKEGLPNGCIGDLLFQRDQ